ncbi:hypothetical protein ACEQPO_14655 [Bacillus sp. SL00103]
MDHAAMSSNTKKAVRFKQKAKRASEIKETKQEAINRAKEIASNKRDFRCYP